MVPPAQGSFPLHPDNLPPAMRPTGMPARAAHGTVPDSPQAPLPDPARRVAGAEPGIERLAALRQQLAHTHEELASLRSLMETLPQLFEQKFQERVGPMLQQRQRLLEQNSSLRDNLHQLAPAGASADGLNGRAARPRLGAALRHAFGLEDSGVA
ncbi:MULTISPECIES: hypothetical protein [Aphanothece]|uniref:hypothetical protein n=1 Tax=Aphanothece TaxID=1121 RepID=UPI0039850D5C